MLVKNKRKKYRLLLMVCAALTMSMLSPKNAYAGEWGEEAALAGQYNVPVYDASGKQYQELVKGSGVAFSEKVIAVIFAKAQNDHSNTMLERAVRVKRAGASLKIIYAVFIEGNNSAADIAAKKAQYPEVEFIDYNEANHDACWEIVRREGLDDGCGNVYTPVTFVIPNDANRYASYAYAGRDNSFEDVLFRACGKGPLVTTTGLTLSHKSVDIGVGQTLQLTATVTPANASYQQPRWKSDDESIATVSATGLVTGVKEGSTWINAYAQDITVDNPVMAYCLVTVQASGGGTNTNTAAISNFVTRAYQEIMLRNPDQSGLDYWTNLLSSKSMGGAQMCVQFLSSPEFRNRGYSTDKIVEICYKAFFDRVADASGKAYWKRLLDNGMSTTYIARGMANSTEFQNICKSYGIVSGTVNITENRDRNEKVTGFVARCYQESLGRNGEADGLNYWTGALHEKKITPAKVAEQFVFSKEMNSKGYDNSRFIQMLYRLCMGRTYDQGGLDYWLGRMGKGMTRQQVFTSFVNSREFQNIVKSYGL